MVWQLPRQQSDNPDRWTDERPVEMKKLKCQSRNRTSERRARRRVQASSSSNGSAYKNNLASNKIGKIASNWIRALLSIDRRGVPARLKHLLRELWEEMGVGVRKGRGGAASCLPTPTVSWEHQTLFFIFLSSRLCNPFTHLRNLNKYCESAGREGKGRSRAMRVECSILK